MEQVSRKLLKIPLWGELSELAISHLQYHNHINHAEVERLKGELYTPKQIMSIFHQKIKNPEELKKILCQTVYTG